MALASLAICRSEVDIMAIWKDNTAARPAPAPVPTPVPEAKEPRKESLIAADITIEGKIEGGGSVRIAGRFKGDVNVQGDLTIEAGAKLTGSVRADRVTIAGELEGNIEQATLVDLLQSAVVVGDLKAGSLTVAAGARLRGQAEFGWDDGKGGKTGVRSTAGIGIGSAA
jgi:cytoskeletal protein CcmA (bactofilin family)